MNDFEEYNIGAYIAGLRSRIAELEATVEEWKRGRDTLQRDFAEEVRKLETARDRYRDVARMLRKALIASSNPNASMIVALMNTSWLDEGTDGE